MNQKSFWEKPEGVTGGVFMAVLLGGGLFLLYKLLPTLIVLAQNSLYLAGILAALGAVLYVVLDPQARNLVWFAYKSVMRWITGLFVQIDPIGILKSYIDELEDNLRKMSKQIGSLRGQMRQLKGIMDGNIAEIRKNMAVAEQAQKQGDEKNLALGTRKAGRLQEANAKYDVLYKKMDVMFRILSKMYENSEIMLEDTKDQVQVKEQEFEAIRASHGAMRSARSVISGDPDKRALFDQALEAMTNEVGAKVGEMERFMDTSRHLLDSIDLQNGVFEDEGLHLLETWEKSSPLLAAPVKGARAAALPEKSLDLNAPPKLPMKEENDYSRMFD